MNKFYLTLTLLFASLTGICQVPTAGLVAWYPLDSSVIDISGNNYNGTPYGVAGAADRFGNPNAAVRFNGSSGYIQLPNLFDLLPRTYSVWFNAYNASGLHFIYCSDNPN